MRKWVSLPDKQPSHIEHLFSLSQRSTHKIARTNFTKHHQHDVTIWKKVKGGKRENRGKKHKIVRWNEENTCLCLSSQWFYRVKSLRWPGETTEMTRWHHWDDRHKKVLWCHFCIVLSEAKLLLFCTITEKSQYHSVFQHLTIAHLKFAKFGRGASYFWESPAFGRKNVSFLNKRS